MAWEAVITNIVTDADLTTELTNYGTVSYVDSQVGTKLDITDGTATNLKLSAVGTDPDSAIAKSNLDAEVSTLNSALTGKASLSGAAFTGAITVQTAVAGEQPVRLDQLGVYLEKTGGTITGPIAYADSPTLGTHLTNKTYVDGVAALKSDLTYVDSELADKADSADLATYMPLSGGTFSGVVDLVEPNIIDDSSQAATTSFVNQRLSDDLALKADLDSPTISNITLTGTTVAPTVAPGDNTTAVATTAFVTDAVSTLETAKADINSPTFTGTPASTTPSVGDDSTRVATTAYVQLNLVNKANSASPSFTGTPTAPLPALAEDSAQIATTAWVRDLLIDAGVLP